MRMMGAESVDYHRATVMDRADDHPGQALDYYAARGDTPLVWGGSGADRLGLFGAVTPDAYEAMYGPGGATDPSTGTRMVRTTRPGMELVVSAHKSVAELGVLGRADDMHRIMDAERDATLSYLDDLTRKAGGRRGRAAMPTPASGLIYAHSRHATSRAGDPCPHDHVLLANVVEMLDERGGFKAPDTTTWREHLHAATMVGRVASARVATELGYGIEADPGPSGRLGHWRIAGIPEQVLEVHSKRKAEIEAEVRAHGHDSYRARNMAARTTRRAKRYEPEGELISRWRAELRQAGFPLPELEASVERASAARVLTSPPSTNQIRELVAAALSPEGALGARKVFARRNAIVALAPHLYGQEPALLDRMVERTLADPEAIPLVGMRGAREPVWSTATTLATEQAIADMVADQLARSDAPAVSVQRTVTAIRAAEHRQGYQLTAAQEDAVTAICTSGRGAELVLGVAGSGKTTMLSMVRHAFEAFGYEVLGTATSGQAARNLGREAGIDQSRTLASLTWRLEHGRTSLSDHSVVVLDEVGMTDDPDLVGLLAHVEAARAKVVLVGDHRQLGGVGPGGALEALVSRHRDQVLVLYENLRQTDPAESQALAALRAGDVEEAVSWYRTHGRVVAAASPDEALDRAVDAWAADLAEGKETALLAWRRANVDELNNRARERMAEAGMLRGTELVAPGGRAYRAGDQVVILAPGADGAVLTSERATVQAVDVERERLALRTKDERRVTFVGEELSAERLAHGYAVTAHRSQGQTTERSHLYVDGGGRELAYVAMSRAKETSHAYLVADNLDQAVEDLAREWSAERRLGWATDVASPVAAPTVEAAAGRRDLEGARTVALSRACLSATHQARQAAAPPDPSLEIVAVNARLREVRQLRRDLGAGEGVWEHTKAGRTARELAQTQRRAAWSSSMAEHARGWRERRSYRKEAEAWSEKQAEARASWDRDGAPEAERLDRLIADGETAIGDLKAGRERRGESLSDSQERKRSSGRRLDDLRLDIEAQRDRLDGIERQAVARRPSRSLVHLRGGVDDGHGIGHDLGRGIGR
ncbi:MAG TPA: MobF family relaxase [Acidimicrobiales bacterium]